MGKAKAQSSDVLLAVAAGLGTAWLFSEWRPLALQYQLSFFCKLHIPLTELGSLVFTTTLISS